MLEKGKQAQAELEAGVVVRTASDIRSRATNFFPLLEVRMTHRSFVQLPFDI